VARAGRRSGRVSYQLLSINQLGAVYEALLSYRGFFASDDLYEVKPAPKRAAAAAMTRMPTATTKVTKMTRLPTTAPAVAAGQRAPRTPTSSTPPGLCPPAASTNTPKTSAW
jgi:hypothetical protein